MTHPWLKSYPPGVDWHAEIAPAPVHAILDDAVARYGDKPCLDFLDRRTSYAELGAMVGEAAKGFRALGVGPGTRVGLYLPNTPHYVIAFFAVLACGGIVVNFSPLYAEAELRGQMQDSEVEIMVTLDLVALYPNLAAAMRDVPLRHVVVGSLLDVLPATKGLLFRLLGRGRVAAVPDDDLHVRFATLMATGGPPVEPARPDPGELAVLQYTGGTTGIPKGAILSHANVTAATLQAVHWTNPIASGDDERVIGILPLYHCFALVVVMLMGIHFGAEIVLHPRFEADKLVKDLERKRITVFPGVPTLFGAVAAHPKAAQADLSNLKLSFSGGAPLPIEMRNTYEALTGLRVDEGYGLTESSGAVCATPFTQHRPDGSVGLPLPGTVVEMRDLEDPTRVMAPGERGEVWVKGPQIMAGYWNREEGLEPVLKDGYLRTGDVGHFDENGFIFLTDRIKDLIICSGHNVYPRVVEEAIYEHPDVLEAIVIGIPDDYRGEAPKAFVTLREGKSLDLDGLTDFLRSRIGRHEMPAALEIRDELPRTPVGKLSKKELIEEEEAERDST